MNIKRILLVFCGISLTIILIAISQILWNMRPSPPLTEGLSSYEHKVASEEFTKRIRERFPIGSSQSDLIKELKRQGFDSAWGQYRGYSSAEVHRTNIACDLKWSISWKSTNENLRGGGTFIDDIFGDYSSTCL